MWPRLFCILMEEEDWAGVHGKVWPGPARPPNPSLLSTGPRPARPSPIPHFYRQGLGQPGSQPLTSIGKPLTFIDGPWASPAPNPSRLLARPLTSISQSPHFYQPGLAADWPQTQTFPWTAAP